MGITHTLFLGIIFTAIIWSWRAQPRVHDRLPARLRRACAHRCQRQRRHDVAVPVHGAQLDAEDVGVRGHDRRRQVPRRRVVLLEPRPGHGPVLDGRGAVLVARLHPRVLAHATSCPPIRASGRGSVGGYPSAGCSALYRATFFYGVCRLIAWSTWAHLVAAPGHQRRRAPRLSARPVVERPVVARGPLAPPRQPVARRARPSLPLLAGVYIVRHQAVGTDGPGAGAVPRPARRQGVAPIGRRPTTPGESHNAPPVTP